ENFPVLLAMIGIWNVNYLNIQTHAVLPYDGRMKYFAAYLQQLEMESNGKSTQRNQEDVEWATCPIVWGEVGPNAQHAFYQLLHQGTQAVSSDFIAPIQRYTAKQFTYENNEEELIEQHHLALANCLAQSRLLAFGSQSLSKDELAQLPKYQHYTGNQPSSTLLLDELNPYTLGMLIALYEHKVFVQSVIWNINPFDQWGVEKGKAIANQILPILNGESANLDGLDSSTQGLIQLLVGKSYG
ncbi:MAG: glucose-6-phosphate isomerase, partial [Wohlfahrtiimonas sp.]